MKKLFLGTAAFFVACGVLTSCNDTKESFLIYPLDAHVIQTNTYHDEEDFESSFSFYLNFASFGGTMETAGVTKDQMFPVSGAFYTDPSYGVKIYEINPTSNSGSKSTVAGYYLMEATAVGSGETATAYYSFTQEQIQSLGRMTVLDTDDHFMSYKNGKFTAYLAEEKVENASSYFFMVENEVSGLPSWSRLNLSMYEATTEKFTYQTENGGQATGLKLTALFSDSNISGSSARVWVGAVSEDSSPGVLLESKQVVITISK